MNFYYVHVLYSEKGLWGLRYAEFVVPMVKAMQEQQALIEKLMKEIEVLKKMK